jgi:hypothetical protein
MSLDLGGFVKSHLHKAGRPVPAHLQAALLEKLRDNRWVSQVGTPGIRIVAR